MKGSAHVDAVLDRVLARRPWISDDVKRAGRGRYVRVYMYRTNVSLQALYCRPGGEHAEAIEVGLVFDDLSREQNEANLDDYREQLGENEQRLGLHLRDGEGGGHIYLTRVFAFNGDPVEVYDQVKRLCLAILDLNLGGPSTRKAYRHGRERFEQQHGAVS